MGKGKEAGEERGGSGWEGTGGKGRGQGRGKEGCEGRGDMREGGEMDLQLW